MRDLDDLQKGRRALGKTAWKRRLKGLLATKKAQDVAKAKFRNFRKVCKEVVDKKRGGASRT